MENQPPEDSLDELIDAWANGTLDGDAFARLQGALKASPEARARFLRVANLDAALRDAASAEDLVGPWREDADARPARSRIIAFPRWAAWPTVAAVAAALVLTAFLARSWWGGEKVERPEAMGEGFAILTQVVGARWTNPAEARKSGDMLARGTIALEAGLAQIEFFSGATVVLEGPGELEIRSASEAYCRSGKLRASVPPAARGFVIETPDGRVVDLGTEFGVAVGKGGESAVHVFDGKVELHDAAGAVRELETGEAFSRGEGLAADDTGFVGAADLDSRLARSNDSRFADWRAFSRDLRRDERLLAYFPMDQPGNWNRRLFNEAPTGSEIDGAIVGANRVEGRWEGVGKSALEFTPTGSRARLVIPGEFTSLTFSCWARIDSLDRQYNALYLTDNYQPGETHWQLHHDGRILFSILVRPNHNLMSWSPPVWDLSKSGRWMHLAAVFDEPEQEIRHYVNGDLVLADPIPPKFEIHTTRLGSGEIGNWGLPNRPDNSWFAIRNLNGRIDEFAIFADALTGEEIARLYDAGNPR